MSRVGLIFVRLFLIMVGYAVAALTASAFLHLVAWPFLAIPGEEAPWLLTGGLFVSIPLVGLFVAYFAFIPFAVSVGIAEILGYRSWLYHVLSGGAAGFVAIAIARRTQGPVPYPGEVVNLDAGLPLLWMPEVATAAITAGMVGATAYWLVAGRSAGLPDRSPPDDRLPK